MSWSKLELDDVVEAGLDNWVFELEASLESFELDEDVSFELDEDGSFCFPKSNFLVVLAPKQNKNDVPVLQKSLRHPISCNGISSYNPGSFGDSLTSVVCLFISKFEEFKEKVEILVSGSSTGGSKRQSRLKSSPNVSIGCGFGMNREAG